MILSNYIPEIKIHAKYNNKILYNKLKNHLDEFINYIDLTYGWNYKPHVSKIEYSDIDDLIILKGYRTGDSYISIDEDQLDNFGVTKEREDNVNYEIIIDKVEYENKIFYIMDLT